MLSIKGVKYFSYFLLITGNCFAQNYANNSDPTQVINRVVDRIIEDSKYESIYKVQQESQSIQSINFNYQFGNKTEAFAYAFGNFNCEEEGTYRFGFSSGSSSIIWINHKNVYTSSNTKEAYFTEYAYERYKLPESFEVHCTKGINQILIKILSSDHWKFYLAPLQVDGLINKKVQFTLEPSLKNQINNWLICYVPKSFSKEQSQIEESILPYHESNDIKTDWSIPKAPIITSLKPLPTSAFKKHTYFEWHYSTGVTLWSILNFALETSNRNYEEFVKKCCNFTIDNLEFYKHQYYDLNEINGFNHRLYRMQMLDDASAPALPYKKLQNLGAISKNDSTLKRVEGYLLNKQARLTDGTFCRPEPWNETIWADDLFMSVPYLMMLGESTGDQKFYNEATFQVKSFYDHLFNQRTKLCRHGWVNSIEKDSIPYWSRANGWMIWAVSEVLLKLPKEHIDYKTILKLYNNHIAGLVAYQDEEGFLHQIVNDSNSFTETSSTAMLTLAIARGINHGWIPKKYKENALRGWAAVKSRIEPDGVVKGICEGTSINTKIEYYLQRKSLDHDPRGLGAIITAGLEVKSLNINK